MFKYLINEVNSYKKQDIAAFGQKYLVKGLSEIVKNCSNDTGITTVALSGGVFVNEYITKTLIQELEKDNLYIILNTKVPPGDGGSALGQIVSALHHVM
jgi:hydrogenase maturation protein HypF